LKQKIKLSLLITVALFCLVIVFKVVGTLTESTTIIFTGQTTENSQRKIYSYQLESRLLIPLKAWYVYRGIVVYPVCVSPYALLLHLDDDVATGDTTVYLSSFNNEKQTTPVVIDNLPRGEKLSLDGHYLFFENNKGTWVLDVYSGFQTKLTDAELFVIAEWSADNNHLVLSVADTSDFRRSRTFVFQMRDLTSATLTAGLKRYSWSYDGSLAVETDLASKQIYLIDPITLSRKERLVSNAGYALWSKTGYTLAYIVESGLKNYVVTTNVVNKSTTKVEVSSDPVAQMTDDFLLSWISNTLVLVQKDHGIDVVDIQKNTVVTHLSSMSIYSTVCVSKGPYH
jgi:hypothetical protein